MPKLKDHHIALMGTVPDSVIARKAGCTNSHVCVQRRRRKIAAFASTAENRSTIEKGHWPKGKRKHKTPADWPDLVEAMHEAARQGLTVQLAAKIGVHVDTIKKRWRSGEDIPAPLMQSRLRHELRRRGLIA